MSVLINVQHFPVEHRTYLDTAAIQTTINSHAKEISRMHNQETGAI